MRVTLFGAIEAGGTKWVVGVGSGPDDISARTVIPTTTPDETIGAAIAWLQRQGPLAAVGVASFGPVELDWRSRYYGFITGTPKPGWGNTDLLGPLGRALGVPIGFDTDVNGAALAEALLGAGRGCACVVYVTVGTGIGGGVVVDGRALHGLGHPEMGHVIPPRHPLDREGTGSCPFHGGCCEGLASGSAIVAQWGAPLSRLPLEHPAHAIVAHYLGHLTASLRMILSPDRVVLGGGVMQTPGLLDAVVRASDSMVADYLKGRGSDIVVAPTLAPDSGLIGAILLAQAALSPPCGARG